MIRISGNINLISFLNRLFFGSLIPLSAISFSPTLFNYPTQKKDVATIGAIDKGHSQNMVNKYWVMNNPLMKI